MFRGDKKVQVITKISVQRKHKDRYNIFIDDGTGEKFAFAVDEDVLIKFNLKKGKHLDDFQIAEINFADNVRKALNIAINYLARRMRSEGEIRTHLKRKEVDDLAINEVVSKLIEMNYLDDKEFAQAYVSTQINTTDKGPNTITRELREKGVNSSLIESSLQQFSIEDQVDKAIQLAKKYIAKNERDSEQILYQKTIQMLNRKGYNNDVTSIVMEEVSTSRDPDEEMKILRVHGERAHRRFKHLPHYEYEQKLKQTLYRRGFKLQLIEKFIKEKQDV